MKPERAEGGAQDLNHQAPHTATEKTSTPDESASPGQSIGSTVSPQPVRLRTLAERFDRHRDLNPHVLATLLKLTDEWAKGTGGKKLGIAALYERCRWELAVTTVGDIYRLNNDHRAFYSRLIAELRPEYAGLFSFRRSAADAWSAARTAEVRIPSPRAPKDDEVGQ